MDRFDCICLDNSAILIFLQIWPIFDLDKLVQFDIDKLGQFYADKLVVSIDLFLISFMPFCTMEYISLVYPMPSSPPPPILTLLSAQTSIMDSPLSLTLAFWGWCFSLTLAYEIHDSFHTVKRKWGLSF